MSTQIDEMGSPAPMLIRVSPQPQNIRLNEKASLGNFQTSPGCNTTTPDTKTPGGLSSRPINSRQLLDAVIDPKMRAILEHQHRMTGLSLPSPSITSQQIVCRGGRGSPRSNTLALNDGAPDEVVIIKGQDLVFLSL